MTDSLLLMIAVGLAGLSALFSFLAFVRTQAAASAAQAASQRVEGLGAAAERTDKTIRDEIARMRNEAEDRGKVLRTEVSQNITGFGDSLRKGIEDNRQALDTRLSSFTEQSEKSAQLLRQDVGQRVASFGEGLKTDVGALSTGITERIEIFTQGLSRDQKSAQALMAEGHRKLEERLSELIDKNEKRHEALRLALETQLTALRTENEAKLEQMRATVDEKLQGTLEKRLGESFKLVSERLETVQRGLGEMQTLAQGVGDLKRVLTNVKSRGGWAEVQLGALIENYLTADQFIRNAEIVEGSGERVEFAVRLPGDSGQPVLLPIDAKFPMEDYERLVDAQEKGDKSGVDDNLKKLEQRVRGQALQISTKYIHPPTTTDFGVLYLPTEGLFAEIMRKPGLASEILQKHRVSIAGPTTLTAILNGLQMGFRSLAIQARSSEVWQILGAAKEEFRKYGDVWVRLKKQLQTATDTVEEAGTRTRALERRLRSVETVAGPTLIEDNSDDED